MSIKEEKKLLLKWLEQPGNSKTLLASMLNYKSSSAIDNWLARKTGIAHREKEKVLKIITR